jgi:hypothetical protein
LTDAIALVHQSGLQLPRTIRDTLRTPEKWRVRNWRHHPYDPGWEEGRYCMCHPQFRTASTRHEGEIVVDCVNAGNVPELGYLVRSYFVIKAIEPCRFSRTGGRDLLFTSYHFCDLDPAFYLRIGTGPLGTKLSETQLEELSNHASYREYSASSVHPTSIDPQDWTRMLLARKNKMESRNSVQVNLEV